MIQITEANKANFAIFCQNFAQNFLTNTNRKFLKFPGIPDRELRLPQFPGIPDRPCLLLSSIVFFLSVLNWPIGEYLYVKRN